MTIKMIVTDLDGTLLRGDKTVSDYTVGVFNRCREKGIKTVFATARPKRAVLGYLDVVEKIPFDGMVFHNGAVIMVDGEEAANFGIAPKTTARLAKGLAGLGLRVAAEIGDEYYTNYDPGAEWQGMRYILTDFGDLPQKPADKLIVRRPSAGDMERVKALIPADLYVEMNEGVLGLIMSRGATKLNAVRFLAERFGIGLSETAAFGDDFNDMETLKSCGMGVAVENALTDVKKAARYVCGSNEADGAARWLESAVLSN